MSDDIGFFSKLKDDLQPLFVSYIYGKAFFTAVKGHPVRFIGHLANDGSIQHIIDTGRQVRFVVVNLDIYRLQIIAQGRRGNNIHKGAGCHRRSFLKTTTLVPFAWRGSSQSVDPRPNIILCMADDQGWGDTGYNGHPVLATPNLDEMARAGIRFERFYAGAPVCSPTRGSCLTGRHPYRYGVTFANTGRLPLEEVSLAEAVKTRGYRTGHFGKWHLGTLTTTVKESNRGGPGSERLFSPPWKHGFVTCFSTEAKVPTWDPMKTPGKNTPFGTNYWNEAGERETSGLEGDDSRIIMDRALGFIRRAAREKQPFLAVIWFHTPHYPVLASPEHRRLYKDQQDAFSTTTGLSRPWTTRWGACPTRRRDRQRG